MQKEELKTIAGVEHPSHYQSNDRLECIEEMRLMFGDEAVILWCKMTAYKYYYRAGNKGGESEAKDKAKALFYLRYMARLAKGETNDPFYNTP